MLKRHFLILLIFFCGCKAEEVVVTIEKLPKVVTNFSSDVNYYSATLNGEVIDDGSSLISERGFVFSKINTGPTLKDSVFLSGVGKGSFSFKLEGLELNSKYYFRAYATNKKGTVLGEVQSFTTKDCNLATSFCEIPRNVEYETVELNGKVLDEGGGNVKESGFVYGTNSSPNISNNKILVSKGKGTLNIWLSHLKSDTKYFVRTYTINEKGVSYGNENIFQTFKINTVVSKTGRVWLDRNLGASQVAISPTDEKAYGDLYQWGRGVDGHQKRDSPISNEYSIVDVPGTNNFFIGQTNWRVPQNDNLWQGVNGINNVCPAGFRLPTKLEWEEEVNSWPNLGILVTKVDLGYNSPLKLTTGGYRFPTNATGSIERSGIEGLYWSSTVDNNINQPFFQWVIKAGGFIFQATRAAGMSVRCIKD